MVATKTISKSNPQTLTSTPKVYSYIRFSTLEQALGDSERRQLERAEAYAKEMGLQLDETLIDEGISGYRGANKKKGALGRFLQRVEKGEVSRGSTLLIENIDRLGREPFTMAFKTITSLIEKGVCLQTLIPRTLYNIESINSHLIYELVGQIKRANEESKRKSDLGQQNWEQKRKKAINGKLTGKCPAWLEAVRDEKGKVFDFKAIPEAVETIKMIFDLKLKKFGKGYITKKLNAGALWMPPKGKGWRESYIQKILQNKAVIGESQPYKINCDTNKREPVGGSISGHFPVIVKPEIFYAAQELFKSNKGKGGRTGKASNLFVHLVKCPYCGDSMVYDNKGKPPKGGNYLICNNARRGLACEKHSIRYDECEKIILENCKGLKPEDILPDPDEQTKFCQSLHQRIQGYIAQQQDIEKRIANLINQISEESNTEVGKRLKHKIEELHQHKIEIKAIQESDESELRKAECSLKSFTKWQTDFASLQKALKSGNMDCRIRLQSHLRELIEKIDVFAKGFNELYDPDKDKNSKLWRKLKKLETLSKEDRKKLFEPKYTDKTDHIHNELEAFEDADFKCTRTKLFRNFVKDLTKRRMSKEGRFLRVYFKTGIWIDLVPDGSLASGMKMYIDDEDGKINYKFIFPPLDKLWEKFKLTHK
ncbi:MAG: recombinase family protein [Sedimentisphaerales bacterium]